MDKDRDRLNNLNREILLANTDYQELLERSEALLRSLEVSIYRLREKLKKLGDDLRRLKIETGNQLQD